MFAMSEMMRIKKGAELADFKLNHRRLLYTSIIPHISWNTDMYFKVVLVSCQLTGGETETFWNWKTFDTKCLLLTGSQNLYFVASEHNLFSD